MVQCNTCGGTYEPIQRDGSRYFHVCPPVAEYFDAQGVPINRDTAESIMKLGGSYRVRYVPRANMRDENPSDERDLKGQAKPKAEGSGVTPIVPPVDPLADTQLVVVPPVIP